MRLALQPLQRLEGGEQVAGEAGEWGIFPMVSTAFGRYRVDTVDEGDPPVWQQMVESVDVWPAGESL